MNPIDCDQSITTYYLFSIDHLFHDRCLNAIFQVNCQIEYEFYFVQTTCSVATIMLELEPSALHLVTFAG